MITVNDYYKQPRYENGRLANNFDLSKDYGKELCKIHFYIDTEGFNSRNGSFDNSFSRELFHSELMKLFLSDGFLRAAGGHDNMANICDVFKGNEHLYFHPSDISGIIYKNNIKNIMEIISISGMCSLRFVSVYENVYDFSESDVIAYLDNIKDSIKNYILSSCKTKRTTYFHYKSDIIGSCSHEFRITTTSLKVYENVANAYIKEMIDRLCIDGYLIKHIQQSNGTELIRSINKTEARRRHLLVS